MIKLFLIFIIINLSLLFNCKLSPIQEFSKEISNYDNYNELFLDEYYQVYNDSNKNIIYALNKINYPNFLKIESYQLPSININNILLVNKSFYLTPYKEGIDLIKVDKVPYIKRENETMLINKETLDNYINLYLFIKNLGYELYIFSAYRNYEKQTNIYHNAKNKEYVAKPGYSEHQSGLALDVSTLDIGITNHLENSNFYSFFINNLHHYGFILRYPKNKEYITGYPYEAWHIRYVGKEVAKVIYEENLTLEEYFYYYLLLDF